MFYRFATPRLRHPLARFIAAILGGLALLALVTLGVFAFLALLVGGAIFMLVNAVRGPRPVKQAKPASANATGNAAMDVIDGEFTVIEQREPSGVRR